MCRLYALRSTRPVRVADDLLAAPNALVCQSRLDSRGECHADGWGLASYDQGRPQRMRSAGAAFDDEAFRGAAEELTSEIVVAHVRDASVGDRRLVNAHPFVIGRWTFAHNGTVPDFDRMNEELTAETQPALVARRQGATDSEAVFAWMLTRLAEAGIELAGPGDIDTRALSKAFAQASAELWARCEAVAPGEAKLNFVLTDGRSLLATRINHSLHWSVAEQGGERVARVASEPLTESGWEEVPNGSVVSIDAEGRLEIAALPTVDRAGGIAVPPEAAGRRSALERT